MVSAAAVALTTPLVPAVSAGTAPDRSVASAPTVAPATQAAVLASARGDDPGYFPADKQGFGTARTSARIHR